MRPLVTVIMALGLLLPAAAPAAAAGADDAVRPRESIATDAELRRILGGAGLDGIEAERLDRFAEWLALDLDRTRARQGTLPLAAEQALRHARHDLRALKSRAPHHPDIPLLERKLSRVERRAR